MSASGFTAYAEAPSKRRATFMRRPRHDEWQWTAGSRRNAAERARYGRRRRVTRTGRAGRQRAEIHPDEREDARRGAVAEHAAGELGAGEEHLGDHRLGVGRQEVARLRDQLVTGADEVLLGDSLRRSFLDGLEEERRFR